jgi:hypothetical protein
MLLQLWQKVLKDGESVLQEMIISDESLHLYSWVTCMSSKKTANVLVMFFGSTNMMVILWCHGRWLTWRSTL